jgi:hypothetical protein
MKKVQFLYPPKAISTKKSLETIGFNFYAILNISYVWYALKLFIIYTYTDNRR